MTGDMYNRKRRLGIFTKLLAQVSRLMTLVRTYRQAPFDLLNDGKRYRVVAMSGRQGYVFHNQRQFALAGRTTRREIRLSRCDLDLLKREKPDNNDEKIQGGKK